jgi:hypothetical protein
LANREFATRSRILHFAFVRSVHGLAYLPPTAKALVDQTARPKVGDHFGVHRKTFALTELDRRMIQPESGQRGQLTLLVREGTVGTIEILDPNDHVATRRMRHQPSDQGGSQIAHVQRPGGRWSESADHASILSSRRPIC